MLNRNVLLETEFDGITGGEDGVVNALRCGLVVHQEFPVEEGAAEEMNESYVSLIIKTR